MVRSIINSKITRTRSEIEIMVLFVEFGLPKVVQKLILVTIIFFSAISIMKSTKFWIQNLIGIIRYNAFHQLTI